MKSLLSPLRLHWDHEPWKAPASRTHSKRFAKSQALGHCAVAFGMRGACSRFRTRFMGRERIVRAPFEPCTPEPASGATPSLSLSKGGSVPDLWTLVLAK